MSYSFDQRNSDQRISPFDQRKRRILDAIDRSPKGSFDAPIVDLLNLINAHRDYVSTSSCSGRIAVFRLGREVKSEKSEDYKSDEEDDVKNDVKVKNTNKGGKWLFVAHEPNKFSPSNDELEIKAVLNRRVYDAIFNGKVWCDGTTKGEEDMSHGTTKGEEDMSHENVENREIINGKEEDEIELKLLYEPFLLHIDCRNLEAGQELLKIAQQGGYRESGLCITGGEDDATRRILVHVRTNAFAMQVPIKKSLLTLPLLSYFLDECMKRFWGNQERMERFQKTVMERFQKNKEGKLESVQQCEKNLLCWVVPVKDAKRYKIMAEDQKIFDKSFGLKKIDKSSTRFEGLVESLLEDELIMIGVTKREEPRIRSLLNEKNPTFRTFVHENRSELIGNNEKGNSKSKKYVNVNKTPKRNVNNTGKNSPKTVRKTQEYLEKKLEYPKKYPKKQQRQLSDYIKEKLRISTGNSFKETDAEVLSGIFVQGNSIGNLTKWKKNGSQILFGKCVLERLRENREFLIGDDKRGDRFCILMRLVMEYFNQFFYGNSAINKRRIRRRNSGIHRIHDMDSKTPIQITSIAIQLEIHDDDFRSGNIIPLVGIVEASTSSSSANATQELETVREENETMEKKTFQFPSIDMHGRSQIVFFKGSLLNNVYTEGSCTTSDQIDYDSTASLLVIVSSLDQVLQEFGSSHVLNGSRVSSENTILSTSPTSSLSLHDTLSWTTQRDNGVTYAWDTSKTMFSAGNISEKIRISKLLKGKSECIVDMFAGIGYWSLQALKVMNYNAFYDGHGSTSVQGKKTKVYACEWNPASVAGFIKGFELTFIRGKEGDRRKKAFRKLLDSSHYHNNYHNDYEEESVIITDQLIEPCHYEIIKVGNASEETTFNVDERKKPISNPINARVFLENGYEIVANSYQILPVKENNLKQKPKPEENHEPILTILQGDCRLSLPYTKGKADRVFLGLLPCTRGFWETAVEMLDLTIPHEKNLVERFMHVHQNVAEAEVETFAEEARQWFESKMGSTIKSSTAQLTEGDNENKGNIQRDKKIGNITVNISHIERVKWYAPRVLHIVVDLKVIIT